MKNMKPGDQLVVQLANTASKVTLKFSDGTEVKLELAPGAIVKTTMGSMSCQVIIEDPDRAVGQIELVD
jgi:hypothetical protein